MLAQVLSEVRTAGGSCWCRQPSLCQVNPARSELRGVAIAAGATAILAPGEHSEVRTAWSIYCRATGSVDVGTGIERGQNCMGVVIAVQLVVLLLAQVLSEVRTTGG